MKTDQKEIEARMRRFEQKCKDEGIKITHQRMEIFRTVAETGDHPDAETVFKSVRARVPTVSMDTVYRTLWWLKELGLITTLGPHRERARFDANLNPHHHFVCTQCGLTRDFYSEDLDKLVLPEDVQSIGHAERVQVEVRGLCAICAGNKTPDTTK